MNGTTINLQVKRVVWGCCISGSVIGGLYLFVGIFLSGGAAQQAAAGAIGCGLAVVPYCIARAVTEILG